MKFVLLLWCLAVNITLLLSQSSSSDDNLFGEAENNISTCNNISFTGSGNTTLSKEEYDCYEIYLNSSRKFSIFKIRAEIQGNRTPERNATTSRNVTGTFEVQIFETIHNESISTSRIIGQARCNDTESLKEQKYFSRNPALLINVTFEGNWTDCNLTIFYDEIIFNITSENIPAKDGCSLVRRLWRPNSINLYRLLGDSDRKDKDKKSNTHIILHYLHLESKVGDYLLVGSGAEPFADYPPLFLMKASNDTKIYVDDETAYIALVTGSSDAERTINISCNRTGVEVKTPTEDPFGILNSTIICFRNASADFFKKNPDSNEFTKFQEEFLNEVKYYTEQEGKLELKDLQDSVVVLHDLESQPNSSERQAIIQVKSKQEKSLLTQKHLNAVIQNFIIKNATSVHELQIHDCLNEEKEKNYLIYLCFPVFIVFFLILWAFKQKVFQQQCSSKKDYEEDPIHAEPNPYTTTPKVCQEDEFGRRQTIVPENALNQTDDRVISFSQFSGNVQLRTSDEIHMTDMTEIPSTSRRAVSSRVVPDFMGKPFITPRRRRSSVQSVFDQEDQSDERRPSTVRNEVTDDHVYDSLRRKEELETQL